MYGRLSQKIPVEETLLEAVVREMSSTKKIKHFVYLL